MYTSEADDGKVPVWLSAASSQFTFQVRECVNARVMLSLNPGVVDTLTYVIDLGGASGHEVLLHHLDEDGNVVNNASARVFGVVDCESPKAFWASWRFGVVEVGQGLPNELPVIRYIDHKAHPVYGLALSSSSTNAAQWTFNAEEGMFSSLEINHFY